MRKSESLAARQGERLYVCREEPRRDAWMLIVAAATPGVIPALHHHFKIRHIGCRVWDVWCRVWDAGCGA